jgi:hypothetical protein
MIDSIETINEMFGSDKKGGSLDNLMLQKRHFLFLGKPKRNRNNKKEGMGKAEKEKQ